jgi:hypothetical protein
MKTSKWRLVVVLVTGLGSAHVGFEQRPTLVLLGKQNLVASEADVKPGPNAATQASYEGALRELIVRLHSKADITT